MLQTRRKTRCRCRCLLLVSLALAMMLLDDAHYYIRVSSPKYYYHYFVDASGTVSNNNERGNIASDTSREELTITEEEAIGDCTENSTTTGAVGTTEDLLQKAERHTKQQQQEKPQDDKDVQYLKRYCVDIGNSNDNNQKHRQPNHYHHECTTDPVAVRQRVDPNHAHVYIDDPLAEGTINLGLQQKVDGTESEQRAIKEIIRLMNKYWFEEVLSNNDYVSVRQYCKNRNELCAFWAAIGECESNRIFMLPNCAPACRLCLLGRTNIATNVG